MIKPESRMNSYFLSLRKLTENSEDNYGPIETYLL